MVVDDETDVADAYAAQLQSEYEVITAYSGEDALDKLTPEVEVVLLDRRMPNLSGDDVLDRIRDRDVNCRVAMVTAVDPDFDIIEMPFDDYIIKPVSRDDLHETTKRLLTCSSYEEKLQEYYALTSKYATLRANKTTPELEDSEEFKELERRREEMKADLKETVSDFEDEDFAAAFRELHITQYEQDAHR
jgi:DNA-binding response OmpR family regulator